jgi:acid phosphatase type 7
MEKFYVQKRRAKRALRSGLLPVVGLMAFSAQALAGGAYVSGDFHQHTTYTDGSYSFGLMMEKSNQFGLDWWANSEHGGAFGTWGLVTGIDLKDTATVAWPNSGITLLGKQNSGKMWRWQSLRDWNFRDVLLYRKVFPDKLIIQGYEMNVPGHEHASMAIVANQFDAINPNVNAIAQFEYMFDNSDTDDSSPEGWVKSSKTGHEKAIEAVSWLQTNYPKQSWVIPAHPERYVYDGKTGWNINHFRDLNTAAPDVFFGFESIPGHQMSSRRGEYGVGRPSYGTDTYGGAGLMSARVGGLWDALLSEGRRFWLFANSDCHNNSDGAGDFFPGEYQKNYTYVAKKKDAQAVADGLRSGNSYVVMGDLIDSLDFKVGGASMGATAQTDSGKVVVTILVRDPQTNNNNRYGDYKNPELDHIDLIAGIVGDRIESTSTKYTVDTVATTQVVARFGKDAGYTDASGVVTKAWTDKGNGWKEIKYTYEEIPAGRKLYFRLRGTNHAVNTPNETDALGNPLIDPETNNATKAFADLWFYSNPAYVMSTEKTTTTSYQITSNSDDVEEWLTPATGQTQEATIGDLDYNSSDLELGCEKGMNANPQMIGLRFKNVNLQNGRLISKAYLQFEVDALDKSADPCNLVIRAEDTDSAATFPTVNTPFALTTRAKLQDSIVWNLQTSDLSVVDAKGNSTDITTLVQSLLNRSGWKSGNAMAFYITGNGTREVESCDGEVAAAPKLILEYAQSESEISAQLLADSIRNAAVTLTASLKEADYTVPSWTLLKRVQTTIAATPTYETLASLKSQVATMGSSEKPYNVCMSINGDPKSRLGFTWYTNVGIKPGVVQIVKGKVSDVSAFASPLQVLNADTLNLYNVNYTVSGNDLSSLAGIANNSKRNYTSHKALSTGLESNTLYSYRVGYDGNWSEVGTFTTAPAAGDPYSFLYIADTQANNDMYFSVSEKTVKTAKSMFPNMQFCIMTGDLVETSGSTNSEWEWEQWFERMQPVWKDMPIAPVCGNHDKSVNRNITNHFNTEKTQFDWDMSTSPGSVYSFMYGDALFIAASTEDYSKTGYLDSLKNYIREAVSLHPEARWKIVFYHKAVLTGSNSHQSDSDAKTVRTALVPVFDELGIDLALQGHDHIYEVIGVSNNLQLVENANKGIVTVSAGGTRENMTGKQGGIYNVQNGTLYFLNNSAGKKKYEPRTQAQMEAAYSAHGITNYWGLFSGKFGQTGEPTFSEVKVTTDTLYLSTYTVNDEGAASLFDDFKVVKHVVTPEPTSVKAPSVRTITIVPNPVESELTVNGVDQVDHLGLYTLTGTLVAEVSNTNKLDVKGFASGTYLLKVLSGSDLFVEKIQVK